MAQGWTALPATGITLLKSFTLISDQAWYAACRTAGVRVTANGGQAWSWQNTGLPAGVDVIDVVPSTVGLLAVVAGPYPNGGIYRWSGSTWVHGTLATAVGVTQLTTGEIIALSNAVAGSSSTGPYRTHVSTDGLTFTVRSGTIFTGVGGAGGIFQDATGRLYVTSEGAGTFRSSDQGATFQGLAPISVTNGTGFAQAADGTILYFAQSTMWRWSGSAWVASQAGHDYRDTVYATAVTSDGAFYIATKHVVNGLYRSTDQGQNWTPFNELQPGPALTIRIYGLASDSQGRLIAALSNGVLWRTTDPVAAPATPTFVVTQEGHVTLDDGVVTGHSGFIHNGTQTQIDAYVVQHYRRI